jgi:hypothetical protein
MRSGAGPLNASASQTPGFAFGLGAGVVDGEEVEDEVVGSTSGCREIRCHLSVVYS